MALAINANSVAKGIDPRNFTLMGFGGAGPLHSVSLAEAIRAKDVISPVHPGITAAIGLLVTELQYEYTRSVLVVLDKASDDEFARVNDVLDDLTARGPAQLDADGVPRASAVSARSPSAAMSGRASNCAPRCPTGALDRKTSMR